MRAVRAVVSFIAFAGCAFVVHPAAATVIADAALSFANLSIAPASGTLSLDDVWTLAAFPGANNTLGEVDVKFDSTASPGSVSQTATVTWAMASGAASALGNPPDLDVSAQASGNIFIPGCKDAAAFAAGDASLSNSFTISGSGLVDVTIGADITGSLHALTDTCGLSAFTETIFNLQVDGSPVLFDHRVISIGPNDTASESFSNVHLGITIPLAAGVSHLLNILVDAEPSGFNIAEPTTAWLVLLALAPLWWRQRRASRTPAAWARQRGAGAGPPALHA